jgi:hypothetical protein
MQKLIEKTYEKIKFPIFLFNKHFESNYLIEIEKSKN